MRRAAFGLAVTMNLALPVAAAPVYFAGETAGVGDPNPFFEDGTYSVFYLKNSSRHPWWMTQTQDLSSWTEPVEAVPVGEAMMACVLADHYLRHRGQVGQQP